MEESGLWAGGQGLRMHAATAKRCLNTCGGLQMVDQVLALTAHSSKPVYQEVYPTKCRFLYGMLLSEISSIVFTVDGHTLY